ncbi:10742_t:CDS:2, partial [Funneliformis caledonium]
MSKEKLIPYSDYFDEYPTDSWSYSSFIRYAFNKRLLPPNPVKVYKKCLDFIEQKYDSLKRSKAISLKKSFKPGQYYTECPRATLAFLGVLLLLCSIRQSIDTIQSALAPPWIGKKMEGEWLASLNKLAKNEEIEEYEYHASLNKDEETRTTSTDPIIDTKGEDVFNQPPSKRVKNNDPEKQRTPKRQKYPPETSGEICNKSIKESESNSPNHDEFDTSDTVDDNDDDSDYVYNSESSSCEETKVTKSARSNSPLHDEFVRVIYNTDEDYSDESVNYDDPNDPDYVYSPSSLNNDEETPSVSPAKRTIHELDQYINTNSKDTT